MFFKPYYVIICMPIISWTQNFFLASLLARFFRPLLYNVFFGQVTFSPTWPNHQSLELTMSSFISWSFEVPAIVHIWLITAVRILVLSSFCIAQHSVPYKTMLLFDAEMCSIILLSLCCAAASSLFPVLHSRRCFYLLGVHLNSSTTRGAL